MPIANVDLTNSLDYFRMITNQCIVAFNYMTSNTYSVSRLTVNPTPSTGFVSVNVANGLIYGNGSGIFSYTNAAITGTFRNSQLQNSSMIFANAAGVLVSTATASLNTGTITLVSNPIDSITNASPFLPAAANAIPRLIAAVGTVTKTQGRFFQNVGGTGVVSHSNGQIFVSNGVSGQLQVATPLGLSGIIASPLGGFVSFTANLISLGNIAFTSTGNSAITVSQNAYPDATTTTTGVIRIRDSISGAAVTTEAGSANSLNVVSNIIAIGAQSGVVNGSGRMVRMNTYTFASIYSNTDTIWKFSNVAAISHLVITAVGGGGGGASANNGNSALTYVVSPGGGSGASIKAIVTREQLLGFADTAGTGNLTIRAFTDPGEADAAGTGGNDLDGRVFPGDKGCGGSNVQIGVQTGGGTGFILFAEGGPGGEFIRALSNVGLGCNSSAYRIPRAQANSLAVAAVIQSSAGRPGYPGVIIQRGVANSGAPYYAAGWGGYGARSCWEQTNYFTTTGDTDEYDVRVFSDTAGSDRNQPGRAVDLDMGMGGSGSVSTINNSGTFDRTGGSGSGGFGAGGGAFVKIEVYTNA